MKNYEYKQLEHLLGKLLTELGCDFCIAPNHLQDGYLIVTYKPDGNQDKQAANYDIESTVAKIKGLPIKAFTLPI